MYYYFELSSYSDFSMTYYSNDKLNLSFLKFYYSAFIHALFLSVESIVSLGALSSTLYGLSMFTSCRSIIATGEYWWTSHKNSSIRNYSVTLKWSSFEAFPLSSCLPALPVTYILPILPSSPSTSGVFLPHECLDSF